ncbi:GNAT family N-acetyltransferase [Psychrosphaera algicola]|uniref:GNAT family N-acetyltransferase n=1 Tax=Psychrosphaera algicola TaxID=3023714 RepID=A0ABT5FE86_9GAMM|nr:GNAT family N-acetyltransferase [Psychrosphaera sp. G1-22]MDC2889359.1 GNAT family N-acetyltransferase [Psychrosphaera sp. G1-22]
MTNLNLNLQASVRNAKLVEASVLTNIALKSKAHWGYDQQFMADCVEELSQSKEKLARENFVYRVAEFDGQVVGFSILENTHLRDISLDALFIDPEFIGFGIGKQLFCDVVEQAKSYRAESITVQSDPNAEGFYLAMGMTLSSKLESGSIPGRMLPTLNLQLT